MNPNVYASYALFSRLKSHGVTHAVISPGSRSTPLAYVAHQLFETTVVIDERDAGFVALGIAESTGRAPVVITTSGSAPTHLFPSVTEAFHSNVPMIVITADRPHEVRGRGAPQTIDQINLFGSGVRYFFDASCPHDEIDASYWQTCADELFIRASGEASVAGPVHLNMGMREPLVPDGDENKTNDFGPFVATDLPKVTELIIDQNVRTRIAQAETVVITIGRNAGIDSGDMTQLAENMLWPILADITSNVRSDERTITAYDSIVRRSDAKKLFPDLIIQLGEPLTSKIWNETIATSEVFAVTQYGDDRDPYGNTDIKIVAHDMNAFVRELISIHTEPSCSFFDDWKHSESDVLETTDLLFQQHKDSEPTLFAELGTMLQHVSPTSVLIASSMPIRYGEWFWRNPSANATFYSHRGTNGIDGMVSSAYGIARGSGRPVLCVLGDVAFAHDVGFLSQCAQLTKSNSECVVFCVIDNDGGAIFRHLDQANNSSLAGSYEDLLQTSPGVNIEAIAGACNANYESGTHEECVSAIDAILKNKTAGTHVVHIVVEHESGPEFMQALRSAIE